MSNSYQVPAGYKLVTDGDYQRFKDMAAKMKALAMVLPEEWLENPETAKAALQEYQKIAKEYDGLKQQADQLNKQLGLSRAELEAHRLSAQYKVHPTFIDKEGLLQIMGIQDEQERAQKLQEFVQAAQQKQLSVLQELGIPVQQEQQPQNPVQAPAQPGVQQPPQQPGVQQTPGIAGNLPVGYGGGAPVGQTTLQQPSEPVITVMNDIFGSELRLGGRKQE